MNTEWFKEGHSDYLDMVSPPDFENLSSPDFITVGESRYMFMKPAHIFSPREVSNEVFTFNQLNEKNLKDDPGTPIQELTPMLHAREESKVSETPSFSNPCYNQLPLLSKNQEIVKTTDNYVNMPQSKSNIKNEKLVEGDKEKFYVNETSRDWEKIVTN